MVDLTRPIIGIENRTAQEVFDIMCDRFRAAERALAERAGVVSVDALAQEIRRVDGSHTLGAGALAEALMPFLTTEPAAQAPVWIAEERLSSLLARIHRDGGHYEARHGTEKAFADADSIIAGLYADVTHPAHSPAAPEGRQDNEPRAYIVHAPEDDHYGTGTDRLQFHPLAQHDMDNGYRQTPLYGRPAHELSGNTGELIDKMAEAIRSDTTSDDTPWATLSEDRKIGWRGDAERALAIVKEYLTVHLPAEQAVTDEMVSRALSAFEKDHPHSRAAMRAALSAALARKEGKG